MIPSTVLVLVVIVRKTYTKLHCRTLVDADTCFDCMYRRSDRASYPSEPTFPNIMFEGEPGLHPPKKLNYSIILSIILSILSKILSILLSIISIISIILSIISIMLSIISIKLGIISIILSIMSIILSCS